MDAPALQCAYLHCKEMLWLLFKLKAGTRSPIYFSNSNSYSQMAGSYFLTMNYFLLTFHYGRRSSFSDIPVSLVPTTPDFSFFLTLQFGMSSCVNALRAGFLKSFGVLKKIILIHWMGHFPFHLLIQVIQFWEILFSLFFLIISIPFSLIYL